MRMDGLYSREVWTSPGFRAKALLVIVEVLGIAEVVWGWKE